MRISTTLLILVCTVLFFGASFQAKAQAPDFTVTNLQHTCGAGTPATGSFVVNITNADLTQDSLTIVVFLGAAIVKQVVIKPVSIPVTRTITGLTGAPTGGGRSYLVLVADENNSSVASNGPNFTIFNFQASVAPGGVTNNTNADCTAPNGAITVNLAGNTSAAAQPIVYSWAGPAGFTDPGTKNISGLRGGDYTLTYKDSNTPATSCTLGPIHITDPAAADFVISGNANICVGDTEDVTVSATTSGYTYDVLDVTAGSAVVASKPGTGSSITITVPAVSLTQGSHTLQVRASQGTCFPKFNNAPDLTVNVNPTPTYNNLPAGTAICSSTTINVNLASLKAGGTDATIFTVTAISSGTMTAAGGSIGTPPYDISATDLGDDVWKNTGNAFQAVTYTITPKINSCAGAAFTVSVNVNPQPAFTTGTATAVCSDQAIGVNLDSQWNGTSVMASSYIIDAITPNGTTRVGGTSTTGPATNTSIAADKWHNTTSAVINVDYKVRPVSAGNCIGDQFTLSVPITPQPDYTTFSVAAVCSQASIGVDLTGHESSGSNLATSFTVTGFTPNGATLIGGSPAVPPFAIAAGDLADDQWKNITNGVVTVVYDIQPQTGSCSGNVFHVNVPITPEPDYASNMAAAACSDASIGVNLDAFANGTSITATAYDITIIASDPLLTAKSVAALPRDNRANTEIGNDQWTNLTAGPLNVLYTVVPKNGTCLGTSFIVTVPITPEPHALDYNSAPDGACSNYAISLDLSTMGAPGTVAADSWVVNSVMSTGLTTTTGAGSGTGSNLIGHDVWINNTSASLPVTYNITPKTGSCAGDPFNVTILIVPIPSYGPYTDATGVCAVPIGIDLATMKNTGSITANDFNLLNVSFTGLTPVGTNTHIAAVNGLSSTDLANDIWSNITSAPINVVYTLVPFSGFNDSCGGNQFDVTIAIKPQPNYGPNAADICSNVAISYDLNSSKAGASSTATSFNISVAPDAGLTNTAGTPAGGTQTSNILADKWQNLTATTADVIYTITPSTNGCDGAPFDVTFTIHPEPVYTPATTLPAICSDAAIGLDLGTLHTSSPNISATLFTYTTVVPAGITPLTGTNPSDAGNNNVISTNQWRNVTSGVLTLEYDITPQSADGCNGTLFKVFVDITPQPDYAPLMVSNICGGSALAIDLTTQKNINSVTADSFFIVTLTFPNMTAGATVTLGGNSIAAGDLADDIFTNVSGATQTVTYTLRPDKGLCSGDPFDVTVTILPQPDYNDDSKTLCSKDALNINLSSLDKGTSIPADSYTIVSIDYDNTQLTSVGTPLNTGAGKSAAEILGHAFKNTTTTSQPVTYHIVPFANGCSGKEFQIQVDVNPEPVGSDDLATICDAVAANYDLQNNINTLGNTLPGIDFSWVAVANANVTGETTSAQATPTITDVLTNTTTTLQTVLYQVTPTSGAGCAGSVFNISIAVTPKPVLVSGQTADVCSGSPVGYEILLSPANAPSGTTFRWAQPVMSDGSVQGSGMANVSADPLGTKHINDVLLNTNSTPITAIYTVIPSLNGCDGDPETIIVTVYQAAIAETGPDQAICTDAGPYPLAGSSISGSATTGTWQIISNPGDGVLNPVAGTIVGDPSTTTFTATVAGDYVLMLQTNDPPGICGPVTDVVTITVTGKPVITPGQSPLVCANDPAAYEILMTAPVPANVVFNWADPDGPGGLTNATAGVNIPLGTAGTKHINDILRNDTNANVSVTYQITPSVGLCFGVQEDILVTVKPGPVVVFGQTKTICSGDPVNYEVLLSPANQPAGTTFSWPDPDGSGSGTSSLNVPADPAGTLHITDTLYNGSGAANSVIYSVISTGPNGCKGVTRDVVIVVNSGAVAEAGNAQVICSSGTATLVGSSIGGLATEGTWTIESSTATGGGDGVLTGGTSTANPAAATFSATLPGNYKLRLTTDDPSGSCNAVSDFVTITVRAPGDPSCTGGTGTCSTVSIAPIVTPAHCNNSDGSVLFDVTPAVPISGGVTLTIDGTGSTILASPRTNFNAFQFDSLAVGTYSYSIQYGDASCIKTGTFSIDRSGTVGVPTASNLIDPICFNGTGTATITAPGETGNTLQWSADGVTWTSFIAGSPVPGLPAGTNVISIQRPGDTCAGGVSITFANPVEIKATFTPADATCNNNDGTIAVSNLTGGTAPYVFALNGTQMNLPADNVLKGLTSDNYTIVITDTNLCTKTFNPVLVSFPGFVGHTAPVTTSPDCTGGGDNGKIEFTITDPGIFQFAVTTDLAIEPTDYNPLGGSLVSINNLTHGEYAIWLKPTGSGVKCATKVQVTLEGAYAVSYSASSTDVICFSQPTSIVVNDIQGAPGLPFSYTLTNTNDNSISTGTITASQALSAYSITGVSNGDYSLLIVQDQSSLVSSCTTPVNGSSQSFVIRGPTAALDTLYIQRSVSVPDLPSGSVLIGVQPSGLEPYETRLELTTPLFASQQFVQDWTMVPLNPDNLKFEQSYTNLYGGQYTLTLRDTAGCVKTYSFNLDVDTDLFIPNIFTPNGDGSNEVFYIRNLPGSDAKLLITNRWGKEVFKSSSYQNDWNGGDTVDGLYYYTVNISGKAYTGWVEILRNQ